MDTESLRQKLIKEFPPIFTREVAVKGVGEVIAVGTLANLDATNQGPPGKVQMGRKVAYMREEFVEWFLARLSKDRIQPPRARAGKRKR